MSHFPDWYLAKASLVLCFRWWMELKFAAILGRSEAGFGLREPKKAEGLAVREICPACCVEAGLDGALDGAGLKAGALALGLNSEARTFRLNLVEEVVDRGVCMLDRWGLLMP